VMGKLCALSNKKLKVACLWLLRWLDVIGIVVSVNVGFLWNLLWIHLFPCFYIDLKN
jgi:hypothetical protein